MTLIIHESIRCPLCSCYPTTPGTVLALRPVHQSDDFNPLLGNLSPESTIVVFSISAVRKTEKAAHEILVWSMSNGLTDERHRNHPLFKGLDGLERPDRHDTYVCGFILRTAIIFVLCYPTIRTVCSFVSIPSFLRRSNKINLAQQSIRLTYKL